MSWICHDPAFVFFHNPRVAGTSIVEALSAVCPLISHAGPDDPGEPSLGLSGYSHHVRDHSIFVPKDCRDYPTIGCVRNPYERELSFYFWHRRHANPRHPVQIAAQMMRFSDYLEFVLRVDGRHYDDFNARMLGIQSRYFEGRYATHLLHFETLQQEFAQVTQTLFGEPVALGHSDATSSLSYNLAAWYTRETGAMVAEYAREDFVRFDYDSREWLTMERKHEPKRSSSRTIDTHT